MQRCRIRTYWYIQSSLGWFGSKNASSLVSSYVNGFEFKSSQGLVNGLHIVRSLSTKAGQVAISEERHTIMDDISRKSVSSRFGSNKFDDAQEKIIDIQNLKHLVKIFSMDIETTGVHRKKERIIEIAFRDLSGGENSCFQTLVNPEQDVKNSGIHGITTDMVNQPYVPRMRDLIPIIIHYFRSRQIPGWPVIIVAHNGLSFDFRFLREEFRRCGKTIPSDWRCLCSLALGRELMRSNAPKLPLGISLEGLGKYYEIPVVGSAHRALTDVNLLTSILGRMTIQLKISVTGLLERSKSFNDLDKVNLKPQKKLKVNLKPQKKLKVNLKPQKKLKVNLKPQKKLKSQQTL